MKPHVFKSGDRVRILDGTKFIKRIGYPLDVNEVFEDIYDSSIIGIKLDGTVIEPKKPEHLKIKLAMDMLGLKYYNIQQRRKFCRAVAYNIVNTKRFGGRNRTIHYHEIPPIDDLNQIYTVAYTRVAKTGMYEKGWSSKSYYGDHDDYQPPYLDNQKTHVILGLSNLDKESYFTTNVEIEKIHVELVE